MTDNVFPLRPRMPSASTEAKRKPDLTISQGEAMDGLLLLFECVEEGDHVKLEGNNSTGTYTLSHLKGRTNTLGKGGVVSFDARGTEDDNPVLALYERLIANGLGSGKLTDEKVYAEWYVRR